MTWQCTAHRISGNVITIVIDMDCVVNSMASQSSVKFKEVKWRTEGSRIILEVAVDVETILSGLNI